MRIAGELGQQSRALARVVASPHGLLLGRASLTSVEASEASAAPLGFASDTLAVPPAGEPGRSQPVRTLDEVSDPEREDSIPLGLTPDGGQRDGYLQPNRSEDAQRARDNWRARSGRISKPFLLRLRGVGPAHAENPVQYHRVC